MNAVKRFEMLMKTYHFEEPLPKPIRKIMLQSKKQLLLKILKEQHRYTFPIFCAVTFFFGLKKIGITISLAKATLVGVILSLTTVVVLGGGAYLSLKIISPYTEHAHKEIPRQPAPVQQEQPQEKEKKANRAASLPAYRVNVVAFDNEAGDAVLTRTITTRIVSELNKIKGKYFANHIAYSRKEITAKKIVVGSVIKMGDTYIISVKIMDPRSTEVSYVTSEQVDSRKEIEKACHQLARNIAIQL